MVAGDLCPSIRCKMCSGIPFTASWVAQVLRSLCNLVWNGAFSVRRWSMRRRCWLGFPTSFGNTSALLDFFAQARQEVGLWLVKTLDFRVVDFLGALPARSCRLMRLREGAQPPDAPVDKFRNWQENTNSIVGSRPLAGPRQQMEVCFYRK